MGTKQTTAKSTKEVMWWIETTPHHKINAIEEPRFVVISGHGVKLRVPVNIWDKCFTKAGETFDNRMYRWDHEAHRDSYKPKEFVFAEAGFDTTIFSTSEDFNKLLDFFGLVYTGQRDRNNAFMFEGEGLKVVTSNNPLTGESNHPDTNPGVRKGFAGYIGVEGDQNKVKDFCRLVKRRCEVYKDFVSGSQPYI